MSHFVVLALVDKKTKTDLASLEKAIEPLLAPYDENTEVEEYDRKCYCVGRAAREDVDKKTTKKFGSIDALRDAFHENKTIVAMKKEQEQLRTRYYEELDKEKDKAERKKVGKRLSELEEQVQKAWQKHIKLDERHIFEKMALGAHPLKNEPNPKCDECKGGGTNKSTYNPKSKWDWYTISGRWPGFLDFSDYDPDADPDNYEKCVHCKGTGKRNDDLGKEERKKNPKYTCNGCSGTGKSMKFSLKQVGFVAPVSQVLSHANDKERDLIPFAIVTKEGWAERGEMGWWACVSNEKDGENWEKEALSILKANLDKLAVVVDCHI